jgi:hypothetical protein
MRLYYIKVIKSRRCGGRDSEAIDLRRCLLLLQRFVAAAVKGVQVALKHDKRLALILLFCDQSKYCSVSDASNTAGMFCPFVCIFHRLKVTMSFEQRDVCAWAWSNSGSKQ